jgi:chorismate dehydratase
VTPYPALAPLRIGCVRYLNSRPLIHDYPGPVRFAHPAELAREMAAGELDAALVPIFEAFGPRVYRLVDGVAIASDGPVYSVFLAHRGELSAIRSISLDPASLTSVHLLQVLLAEFHGVKPRCVPEASGEQTDARLLIGNQAIAFRQQAEPGWQYLDLGEEWRRQTGLPFVFAAWLLRDGLPETSYVAREFRALKKAGLQRLEEILAAETEYGHAFARTYLTEHIRFDLGPREREAIELFRRLAHKHGFIPAPARPLEFV